EQGADDHDLSVELPAEEIRIASFGAGMQIGKREGRNDVLAAVEIESQRVRHGAWYLIILKRHPAGGRRFGPGVQRPRCQLERHRGDWLVVDRKGRRYPSYH